MRGPRTLSATLAVTVLVGSILVAGPAHSYTKIVSDRNDVRGALDLRSVSQSHTNARSVMHSFTTFSRFPSDLLRGDNYFSAGFSTDGNVADAERFLFVFYFRGRLRGVITDRRGAVLYTARPSRPNGRTVKVKMSVNTLGNPKGYHWIGFSNYRDRGACSRGCLDAAPNRRPLLHDYSPPTITKLPFPAITTEQSAEPTFPVSFLIADPGYSGVRSWRLERRTEGTSSWSTAKQGRGSGTKSVQMSGAEGETYEFRVVAVDRQGNRRITSIGRTTVPLDDSNPTLAGGFSANWTAAGSPGDYQETLHTTSVDGSSLTLSFSGTELWWVAPASDGVATLTIDSGARNVYLSEFSGQRQTVYHLSFPASPGPHTVRIDSVNGTVSVDAIGFR